VPSGFIAELLHTLTLNLKANGVEPAAQGRGNIQAVALSIHGERQPLIGLRKLANEELRIIAAFSGTNFEDDR
jgi:hypothetical protein